MFELPFVHTNNPAATNLAMRAMFDQYLKTEYSGVHVLFLHVHAGQGIQMVDKLVRKPDDLKGLKMRIPTRTGAWIIEALGASPVGMPVPDLPQALAKKVVDGAFIPWEIIPALKLQDQIKYEIEGPNKVRFGNTTFQVSMNEARWNSLPADVQTGVHRKLRRSLGAARGRGLGCERRRRTSPWRPRPATSTSSLTEAELDQFKEKLEPVVQRWDRRRQGQGYRRRSPGQGGARGDREVLEVASMHEAVPPAVQEPPTLLHRVIEGWALVGGALLLAIAFMTAWSATSGWLLGRPLPGDVELVEMLTAISVFTFLPYCQLTGANVTADLFTAGAGPRTVARLEAAGAVIALAFSLLLLWRMCEGFLDYRRYVETTTILQIPIWVAYPPALLSLALLAAAAFVTVRDAGGRARRPG